MKLVLLSVMAAGIAWCSPAISRKTNSTFTIVTHMKAPTQDVMTYKMWRKHYVEDPFFHPHQALAAKRASDKWDNDKRRAIYRKNLKTIVLHNKRYRAGEVGYKMGVNEYSDLSWEEFKATVGLGGCTLKRSEGGKVANFTHEAADGVDWRTEGAVTAVKNQAHCGSCWAFSTTGSTEGAVKIAGGQLISLSEQQLVDCAKAEGNHGCEGGLMDYGFKYIIDNGGIDSEADYRYTAEDGTCNRAKAAKKISTIKSYNDVTPESASELKRALTQQPVSVAIEADKSAFQHYTGGVFDDLMCGTNLDHGVLAVGYNSQAWIVKNSWGATWGDAGYIQMSTDVASSKGLCGILMQPSFPNAGTAPPSPGPTPGPGTDYEDPAKTGSCSSGEIDAQIQGIKGDMCLPQCSSTGSCPDPPAGFHATAECVIKDSSSGKQYCGLICNPDSVFSCKRSVEATCKSIQGTGICTYND